MDGFFTVNLFLGAHRKYCSLQTNNATKYVKEQVIIVTTSCIKGQMVREASIILTENRDNVSEEVEEYALLYFKADLSLYLSL